MARRDGDQVGFLAALCESAGSQTIRPYPKDAFDELVVTVFEGHKAHVWVIPAFVLEAQNCFRSDDCAGVTGMHVYLPGTEQATQVWGFTTEYYRGVYDVTLPDEAYEASPALFQELFPRASVDALNANASGVVYEDPQLMPEPKQCKSKAKAPKVVIVPRPIFDDSSDSD